MIALHVHPHATLPWEEFVQTATPFSIALDGYVPGPPSPRAHGSGLRPEDIYAFMERVKIG